MEMYNVLLIHLEKYTKNSDTLNWGVNCISKYPPPLVIGFM
jgi:hypothetical protein